MRTRWKMLRNSLRNHFQQSLFNSDPDISVFRRSSEALSSCETFSAAFLDALKITNVKSIGNVKTKIHKKNFESKSFFRMAGALNWFLSDLNLNLIPGFVSRKNCFFIVEFVRKLMLNRFQKMYSWNVSSF